MEAMKSIDVIVPAFNEGKIIGACLTALTHQTYTGPYRIIVMDNNSVDDTAKIASSFPGVMVKSEKKKGYVFAVKTGVETWSTAEIIAHTDADTQVPPTWLESIADAFDHDPTVVAAGGPFYLLNGSIVVRYFMNTINYLFPLLLNSRLCGVNMAYRRSAYDRAGGFDPSVNFGADTFLIMKLTKYGKIRVSRSQYVRTSSRRFGTFSRFIKESFLQVTNFLSLALYKKPRYLNSSDIRE